ncbi:MAG TPA: sugar ABC transporter substrate-binding protein [Chloroflexota bacterium]|nr:sugar ABC transporter substrate-binding protein [Chloroflexota bacterium]
MPLTRRSAVSTLGAGLVGVFAAACGGSGAQTTAGSGAPTKAPVTIQFAHWGTPDYYERNRQRADDFQQKYPTIKVDILHIQDDFQPKILAMFVAGTPPDTHVLDMPKVQAYARRNVILPLNPLMREDKSFKADLLHKKAVEIMSNPKGELLGMPSGGSPNLFYYNRDMFKAVGLPTPYELYQQNKWTWQSFLDSARTLTRGGPGAWQVAGASTGLHRMWMNSNGMEEFDDYRAPKKILYDQPANVETLQYLTDLRHKHKTTPANFSREMGSDDTKAFIEGRVAMMARWTSGIGQFKDINNFAWGMVPYPKGPNPKGVMANDYATSGPAIATVSKYPKESWEWVKFTANDDGQKIASLAGGGTGVYFSDAANQEVIKQLRAIKTLETPTMTVDLMKKGSSFVRLLSADEVEINRLLNTNLTPMWNGEDSPPSAAKKAADAVNDFLRANPQ